MSEGQHYSIDCISSIYQVVFGVKQLPLHLHPLSMDNEVENVLAAILKENYSRPYQ